MVAYAIQSVVSLFWGFSFSRSFLVENKVLYSGSAEPVLLLIGNYVLSIGNGTPSWIDCCVRNW